MLLPFHIQSFFGSVNRPGSDDVNKDPLKRSMLRTIRKTITSILKFVTYTVPAVRTYSSREVGSACCINLKFVIKRIQSGTAHQGARRDEVVAAFRDAGKP